MSLLLKPFRLKTVAKFVKQPKLKILDIGSGSHSSTITKRWIPDCHYTGVDRDRNYDNNEVDLKNMDDFIQLDLTKLDFESIEDNAYDVIIMSHVIEHLYNGDKVLRKLLPKLKQGGVFYLEFPCEKSATFPSRKETLNFFDDDTHVRIYSIKEVCNIFMDEDFQVLKAGKNRSTINILMMPFKVVLQLLTKGYVRGGVFWDWYGFADYAVARKR